jgi:large subunit ribosomal protein L7/L12
MDETTKPTPATEPVATPVVAPAPAPAPKAEVKAEATATVPEKFKDIVSKIEGMSVLDLHELVKVLEAKFGVSAAAVASAGPAAGAGEEVEAKTAFTVELTAAGEQKIAVMKVVKEVLALGLKEAKDLVDGAPSVLKAGMKKDEADDFKKKLEAAGAKVTLK